MNNQENISKAIIDLKELCRENGKLEERNRIYDGVIKVLDERLVTPECRDELMGVIFNRNESSSN